MKPKYLLLLPLLCALPAFAAVDEAPFQALKSYDFQNRKPVEAINAMIRSADGATMADIEAHLLTVLQDPAATFAAQEEIGRMLRVVGTARSVSALAKLLTDEKLGNVARFALERIPDAAAVKALREALPAVKGKMLVGIVNSLGERRDAAAAPLIKPLAPDADVDVANAAIAALGKIGTRDAVATLQALPNKSLLAYQSLLLAADGALKRKGNAKDAHAIYRQILDDKAAPTPARIAAARGLLDSDTMQASPTILELLRGDDADLRAVAARFVRTSTVPTRQLSAEVEKLPVPGQALLLGALADRNDPTIVPVLLRAAASPDADLRIAAMRSFASLQAGADAQANMSIAVLLAKAIVDGMRGNKVEEEAARYGLYGMRGAAMDDAIMAAIPGAEPETRRELVFALGQRYTQSAKPLLFKIAVDDTSTSQDNAFAALNEVAGAEDYAAAVGVLLSIKNNGVRGVAESLVARLTKLVPEADRANALIAALPAAPFETRASILKMLAAQGGTSALNALRADAQNADPKIQDAAIRALANTPDAAAMKDLLDLAKTAPGKVQQILALRGYLRLAEGRPNAVEIYEPALKVASEAQEKKTIISGLSKTNTPQALALITPLLDDEAVRNEAALAALGIAKSIAGKNPAEAKAALDKIVAVSKDENTVKQANEALKSVRVP